MAIFCGKCGAQLNDGATFCTNCGSPLNNAAAQNVNQMGAVPQGQPVNAAQNQYGANAQAYQNAQNTYPQQPINGAQPYGQYPMGTQAVKKPVNKNLLIIGGALAVLIIVLVIVIALISGSGYKKPLDNMVKVIEDGDADAYEEMVFSEGLFSLLGYDFDDMAEEVHEDYVDDYGTKLKVSYKIVSKEKADKSDLEDINDAMELLGSNYKVKKAYALEVDFKIKGSEDSDTETFDLYVIKTSDGWSFMEDPF